MRVEVGPRDLADGRGHRWCGATTPTQVGRAARRGRGRPSPALLDAGPGRPAGRRPPRAATPAPSTSPRSTRRWRRPTTGLARVPWSALAATDGEEALAEARASPCAACARPDGALPAERRRPDTIAVVAAHGRSLPALVRRRSPAAPARHRLPWRHHGRRTDLFSLSSFGRCSPKAWARAHAFRLGRSRSAREEVPGHDRGRARPRLRRAPARRSRPRALRPRARRRRPARQRRPAGRHRPRRHRPGHPGRLPRSSTTTIRSPGHYTLEVSSPGIERPLRTPEPLRAGRRPAVTVRTHADVEGDRRVRASCWPPTPTASPCAVEDGAERTDQSLRGHRAGPHRLRVGCPAPAAAPPTPEEEGTRHEPTWT